MRVLALILFACCLTACGCAVDPGDSTSVDGYWDGCWSEAKKRY